MAYQTYITDAIVLGSFMSLSADKTYLLFTERAGLVYATARSVREERSRQRFALQDFSHITVTLVKGKGGWRIGSVESHTNFFLSATTRAARGSVVKITKLLRRYVHGEEANPLLYTEFISALQILGTADLPHREGYETCASVRCLGLLGYVAVTPTLEPVLTCPLPALTPTMLESVMSDLTLSYRAAQQASHLAE